ncbi:hypothetical protein Val02_92440 [Virgisporangium aliadipatigenens]|uniref:Uncharacterized protein n=1 Tax=Virgisporangium aliadipatigenens TaxID=741659 RepID=A0A8J3YZD1_9ACTN|nr:hypothetical protein [Virgisporangium aliadipatigenens]GIJ52358.1 hypothetical protein Val02_92440 [Virgisporangium aliadipatigenens]
MRWLPLVSLVFAPLVLGASPVLAAAPRPAVGNVVVVGIPGLRWADVSADRTPTLARLVESGSVGSLSTRAAPAPPHVTCGGEGWLTLGAGTYAAVRDPAGIDAEAGCAGREAPPVSVDPSGGAECGAGVSCGAGRVDAMPALVRLNGGLRFDAKPGTLGAALPCAAAVGPGAALAVAAPDGRVPFYAPVVPEDPAALLRRCPLSTVDLGALPEGAGRAEALAAADRALSTVERHRPQGSVLLVLGLADAGGDGPRLHVAVAHGPGFAGGWLRSASTRRTPYVQLSDVAPTAVRLLGLPVPAGLAGAPLTGGAAGRPDRLDATVAALRDDDAASTAHAGAVATFFVLYGLLIVGVLALWRWRFFPPAATGLAAVPVATFLAQLVPWWRAPWPGVTVALVTLLAAAGLAAVAHLGRTPALVVAGATVLVLTVDGLTGTTLQIDSMFGYSPLVAGRFTGFGNMAFAVYGAAAVLLVALLARGVTGRLRTACVVGAVAVPVIAVDGAPGWGADFGGVLTLVPAFVVLGLLLTGTRVDPWKLLAAGAAGAVVVAGLAYADHLRPPDARSHFGRFAGSVLDGSAGSTVERKLRANLDLLTAGPHTVAALALVLALTWWAVRTARLREAALGTAVLGWIGFATNDSGVAVPLVVALVAVPALLATALGPPATRWTPRRRRQRPVAAPAG